MVTCGVLHSIGNMIWDVSGKGCRILVGSPLSTGLEACTFLHQQSTVVSPLLLSWGAIQAAYCDGQKIFSVVLILECSN